jgi:uncharacterized membrane protein (UPF0127 family)
MNNRTVGILLLCGGLLVGVSAYMTMNRQGTPIDNTISATVQTDNATSTMTTPTSEEAVIAQWYAPLTSFTLGRISMQASIADTNAERAQGLSDTPYIPAGIAKVFIFDTSEKWSFWMKDMNYPIDIFWLDENGYVVHVVENASPDSYPEFSFVPPTPAKYVIETKAGFAKENNIGVGAVAGMTEILRQY